MVTYLQRLMYLDTWLDLLNLPIFVHGWTALFVPLRPRIRTQPVNDVTKRFHPHCYSIIFCTVFVQQLQRELKNIFWVSTKLLFWMCFWIKKLKQIVKLGVGVRAREKIVVFKSEFNWSATNRKLTLSLNIFQNDYAAVYTPT